MEASALQLIIQNLINSFYHCKHQGGGGLVVTAFAEVSGAILDMDKMCQAHFCVPCSDIAI